MGNLELQHHGVKGQRWGIIRKNPSGGSSVKTVKSSAKKSVAPTTSPVKKAREFTDAELKEAIARLELEKRYSDLIKAEPAKVSKGKEFIMDVLEKSGKNIATQAATYALGALVNKAVGTEIVNPKKGQKDK